MNHYLCQNDCKSKLGKRMQAFRADSPSEWLMDEFIREVEEMHELIQTLKNNRSADNDNNR